jgi:uncharacterized repeat protein (TIGR02543 family)
MKKILLFTLSFSILLLMFFATPARTYATGTSFDTSTVLPSTTQLRIYFDSSSIAAYLTGAGTGSDIDIITSDGGSYELVINRYNLDGGYSSQTLEINGIDIFKFQYDPITDYATYATYYEDEYIDIDTTGFNINERNIHSVSAAASTLSLSYEDMNAPFTVTFDSNGGTAVSPQDVEIGELAIKPNDPTKEDHVFVGWYKTPTLSGEWNFNIDTVTEDLTLYAKWRIEIEPGINNWLEDSTLNTPFGKTMIAIVMMSIVVFALALLKAPPPVIVMSIVVLFLLFHVFGFIPDWIAIVLTIFMFVFLYISIKENGGVIDD